MGFKLQIFTIIFVVFIIYSSYTFAPWHEAPNDIPSPDIIKHCEGWVTMYGFSEKNTEHNRQEALARSRKFDPDVADSAALYAQILCSFYVNGKFTPKDFCDKHIIDDDTPFRAFKKMKRDCLNWLFTYGYTENPDISHWRKSQNRNKDEDDYISIWAATYSQYLDNFTEDPNFTTFTFCEKMSGSFVLDGIFRSRSFISMTYGTMACEDWIIFAGYTYSDFDENTKRTHDNLVFEFYKNTWAQRYGDYLRYRFKKHPSKRAPKMSPREFCENHDADHSKLYGYKH